MTWVSVSLRKMELKNRINNLESQLIDISQRMQTIADEKASEQTKNALQSNFELSQVRTKYLKDVTSIFSGTSIASIYGADNNPAIIQDAILSKYYDKDGTLDVNKLKDDFGIDVADTKLNINDLYDDYFAGDNPPADIFKNLEGNEGKYLANWQATSDYLDDKMSLTASNQAESDALRSEADAESQALEAQQEQIQTQLKAARAEYDNLGEALDKDIQTSTIKLV